MKLKKLLIAVLMVLTAQLTVFGQNDFGFKANIVASYIPSKNKSSYYSFSNEKNYLCPSGQIGIFYNYNYGNNSLLGADLLFNQVESRESHNDTFTGESVYYEHRMHLTYLSLPIYYGYKIRNFSFNLGFQTSLKLGTSDQVKIVSFGATESEGRQKLLYIDNLDFGPKVGVSYNLTTNLGFEGTYYYGINNISHSSSMYRNVEWRIRQFTVGIRYILSQN